MTSNKNIRIAIQKQGRLQDPSLDFINSLGFEFNRAQLGELIITCTNAPIEILFVRNSDIPEYIKAGVADFGIVGQNVIYERKENYKIIKRLGFGRCKLVIASPKKSSIRTVGDLQDERIATSYVNSLQQFLRKNNINASLININGSVEIAPVLGLSDAVCDITQTGNTLKAYKLQPIATILKSEAVLIESPFANKNKNIILDKIQYENNQTC